MAEQDRLGEDEVTGNPAQADGTAASIHTDAKSDHSAEPREKPNPETSELLRRPDEESIPGSSIIVSGTGGEKDGEIVGRIFPKGEGPTGPQTHLPVALIDTGWAATIEAFADNSKGTQIIENMKAGEPWVIISDSPDPRQAAVESLLDQNVFMLERIADTPDDADEVGRNLTAALNEVPGMIQRKKETEARIVKNHARNIILGTAREGLRSALSPAREAATPPPPPTRS